MEKDKCQLRQTEAKNLPLKTCVGRSRYAETASPTFFKNQHILILPSYSDIPEKAMPTHPPLTSYFKKEVYNGHQHAQ
ncbi:hypothetical protein [Desulforapulum autotrophicum]|uniref:hypothetical protein n=1 Tax=Desulforapulum autotrophicum TaxID=2296 RepID=UPI001E601A71|nr:hypothetical protein [Desulforapulum autotrophicum]